MDLTLLTRICLVIVSLFDIVPGLIHVLAPDGGAGSIAGIVLDWDGTSIQVDGEDWNSSDYHKQTVLVLFSALGLIQIKLGTIVGLMSISLQGKLLYRLTITLMAFQILKIIIDLFGYRNIHSIAPYAPGGYKPAVMTVFYVIATISQIVQDPVREPRESVPNTPSWTRRIVES